MKGGAAIGAVALAMGLACAASAAQTAEALELEAKGAAAVQSAQLDRKAVRTIQDAIAALQEAPTPQGDIGQWFGPDSYPAEALRNGEQGRVVATVRVDATGKVTGCEIAGSSGSTSLDARTCEIATTRMTLSPAKDRRGHALASIFTLPVRWVLPQTGEPVDVATTPPPNVLMEVALTVAGDGKVERCVVQQAVPLTPMDLCAQYPVGRRLNAGAFRNGKPVRSHVVQRYSTTTTYDQ